MNYAAKWCITLFWCLVISAHPPHGFFLVPSLLGLFAGTGLAAVFINISVENFAGWKYSVTFSIIQKSYVAGFIVYILINLVLVYSSVYIITQFSPAAAGSGIPEIKGYLNGEINSSVFLGLCWMLIQLIQKSHVHQECWFSFVFRSWYSRHPSFQNFDWKGMMGCIFLKAGWDVCNFRICLSLNFKIFLCFTGIWKHWFSGGRPRFG